MKINLTFLILLCLSLSSIAIAQSNCGEQTSQMSIMPQSPVNMTIVWVEEPDDVGEYIVWYRTAGDSPEDLNRGAWKRSQPSYNKSSILLTLLEENQRYEYGLEKKCPDNTTTGLYMIGAFSTGEKCGAAACTPPAFATSGTWCNPKATEAQIYWQYVNGMGFGRIGNNMDAYKIRYKPRGESIWTTLRSAFPNKRLRNLIPDTYYEYQVDALCSNGERTTFSQSFFFRTLP